jgi:phage terminase large subunit
VTTAQLQLPPKLIPVFLGEADFRGAFGGRGSAKTRSFAKMTAVRGYQWSQAGEEGLIVGGREYMNSLDESSMAEIKAAILSEPWLADHYDIGEKYIRTRDRRIEYDFIGLRHNIDSVKSKARIKLLWVDEAEPVSDTAWQKAIPSVREEDAEIWVTWNPESKTSATHKRFREKPADRSKIVEINWRDNPWFPAILDRRRVEDQRDRPDSYDHVWEGGFRTHFEGAYFASQLTEARAKGRVGTLAADPLMTYRAFWDIGGTGAKADLTAIWIAQFIGQSIFVLDYYEAQGQPLATHVNWLRSNGYGNAFCILPHDGANSEKVFDASYEGALRQAGFSVVVVPNQGRGAAIMRVEAARRLFPRIWFNAETTGPGLDALGAYHEKRDDKRNIGLGPNHDWSSHGADAFGLMCVAYEAPVERTKPKPREHAGAGSWMG